MGTVFAIASPLICYAADRFARQETGYQFGYELLMLNGILTFAGMWIVSKKQLKMNFKTNKKYGNNQC